LNANDVDVAGKSLMMRGVLLSVVFLAGCAATVPRVSMWESIEPFDNSAPTVPLELPEYPDFDFAGDGASVTLEGAQTLLVYREAADANYTIALEHSQQIAELRTAYNALARAGQAEFELSELRKQTLEDERVARWWDSFIQWSMIIVLGFAAAD